MKLCLIIMMSAMCLTNSDTYKVKRFAAMYPDKVTLQDYAIATKDFEPNSMPEITCTVSGNTETIEYRCTCGYTATFTVTGSAAIPLFNVHLWCPSCGKRQAADRPGS